MGLSAGASHTAGNRPLPSSDGTLDLQFPPRQGAAGTFAAEPAVPIPAATRQLTPQEFTLQVTDYLRGAQEPARLELIANNIFAQNFSQEQLLSLVRHLDLTARVLENGQSFLAKAFSSGASIPLLRGLQKLGFATLIPGSSVTYYVSAEKESVPQTELVGLIIDRLENSSEAVRNAARQYFDLIPSPFQLYLYLEAARQLGEPRMNERGLAFFQVATNMLYLPEAERPLQPLIDQYKQSMLPRSQPLKTATGFHHNAAEMMLLANPSPDENHLAPKSKNGARSLFKSERGLIWAMERIGSMTFSFSRFRHDARQVSGDSDSIVSNGLLVDFGGQYIANPERTARSEIVRTTGPQPYGAQIFFPAGQLNFKYSSFDLDRKSVTRKFSPGTTVSLRQGYYLVENPACGVLFIRNSSPEFGRSLMSAPALFLDYSELSTKAGKFKLSREELLYPSPRLFELAKTLSDFSTIKPESTKRLNLLLDDLQGFFQQYNRWKFDTSETSWNGAGSGRKSDLVGAHLSPGFSKFVHHLAELYARHGANESFQLAFVHPDYPSWRSYRFDDTDGIQQKALLVDDKVMRALELLAKNRCPREVLVDSNLFNFIQQAGINRRAELIIQSA